jgi:legumain
MIASMLTSASAAQWAVIMAGSNGYGNYRHQADACHAYQIAKTNGIPETNIILLAYDDIANNYGNPFPGKIFNKPTAAGVPGKDVYDGCKISYRGKDVTSENFLKVLSGDTSAPGPVLKSTAEDHVFVYYADHGGVGILGVPSGAQGGYIHASDINQAIETLQSKGGYKELLFYLEACESGSIFDGLLKAPNAKAVTAANPRESSWGWYCPYISDGGDTVDGKHIGSCLGDEFSVRWMEDTDAAQLAGRLNSETVGKQVQKVKTAVKKSHVQEYGVNSFDSEPIGDFEGGKKILLSSKLPSNSLPSLQGSGIDSRQVEVHQAYSQVMRAETAEKRKDAEQELQAVLAKRHAADVKFAKVASAACEGGRCSEDEVLEGPVETFNAECHKVSMKVAAQHCGTFTDYSLRYSRLFANLCEIGTDPSAMHKAIEKGCGKAVVV